MFRRIGPALLILAAIVLIAADHNPSITGLTVHEWGTFTSIAGQDGSAMVWNSLACPEDLPAFVNDLGVRGAKWSLWGNVRMETPVLYFYTPRETQASVTVKFPQGVITEWYPQGDSAIYQGARLPPNLNGIDTSLRHTTGVIQWRDILIQPGTSPELLTSPRPSHYFAARGTDAAPITVGREHEKFLFYRGVGRIPVPLSVRVDEKIVIEKRGDDPIPGVILFENRGGKIGYRSVGTVRDSVSLDAPSLDGSLADLLQQLETTLVAQGLYAKEAHAMVETWRDSWFEEGSRVFYIVPKHAIEDTLPLNIEPAPQQIARAFVGRIELITPATIQSVTEAIARDDRTTLNRYGRFLGPILTRVPGRPTAASVGVTQCR